MNKRECLYELSDLRLDNVLPQMTSVQLDEYWDQLHSFIDGYPLLEADIRIHLANENQPDLFAALTSLGDLLSDIHAEDLAQEIQAQLTTYADADNVRYDKLEAFMRYFLASVSILSIDIQKVELLDMDAKEKIRLSEKTDRQKIILAVDDNAVHLNALKVHLQGAPYKLVCLSSGENAIRYLEKNQPDLFILDIKMPIMDGIELAAKIKDLGQTANIVFLTGNATRELVKRAVEAGGVDFIVKPSTQDYVLAKIEKLI
jgi:CheY-like chemotaxis protein